MLLKLHDELENGHPITLEKRIGTKDVSRLGAFACGSILTLLVNVPCAFGAAGVVLRLARDGVWEQDMPLSFCSRDGSCDRYCIQLDTAEISKPEGFGLFYYEYLFLRGTDTLFSNSVNNVDWTLSNHTASRFRMLIYEKTFDTPHWFRGGTMYHIFLDRFFRGKGTAVLHEGASLEADWQHGIPQYAEHAGDELANNVFFGGNLWGVTQKLDELASLGVTVIYLSPIFRADSNHRYDTGDYEIIDELLGGEEAFEQLLREAHARGIRVLLDGVFNHTGDDSKYFNRRGNYPTVGAYQSEESPFFDWFTFYQFPNSYACWWNISILPRLNHQNDACRRYFTGSGGIAQKWLLKGADGWRLDVADELSDAFLDELRITVKETTGGEGILIGEVWENAADKIAYGQRRRYFSGKQLDSVMNYPFRNAVLALLTEKDAETFYQILTELYASYPTQVSHCLMNVLGTHDTARILTLLGDEGMGEGCSNAELAHLRLTPAQRKHALHRLKLASALQFTVFGVPSVYYGDEVGMEGYRDPFCRMPYPWGAEDEDLKAHYRALGTLRQTHASLKDGEFRFLEHAEHYFTYERMNNEDRLLVLANVGEPHTFHFSNEWENALTGETVGMHPTLPTDGFLILTTQKIE